MTKACEWQPIETAPKDGRSILIYGRVKDHPEGMVRFVKNGIYTGYYDYIDEAFCVSAATWEGPFVEAAHWMPLPPPPGKE